MGLYGDSLFLFQAAWNETAWLWPEGFISRMVHSIKAVAPELTARGLNFPSCGSLCGFLGLLTVWWLASRAEHSEKVWWKCMTFLCPTFRSHVTSLQWQSKVWGTSRSCRWKNVSNGRYYYSYSWGKKTSLLQLVLLKKSSCLWATCKLLIAFKKIFIFDLFFIGICASYIENINLLSIISIANVFFVCFCLFP